MAGAMSIKVRGSFKKTQAFLTKAGNVKQSISRILEKYGMEGVRALSSATPVDTGKTAGSWYYEVIQNSGSFAITFRNSNVVDGLPIAILLQYGHATGGGGYVQGRDYINPALRPIFDRLAEEAWTEVVK